MWKPFFVFPYSKKLTNPNIPDVSSEWSLSLLQSSEYLQINEVIYVSHKTRNGIILLRYEIQFLCYVVDLSWPTFNLSGKCYNQIQYLTA